MVGSVLVARLVPAVGKKLAAMLEKQSHEGDY
jgi:hypothetical protein